MKDFPARVNRTVLIADLKSSGVLCGRVIGLIDVDETGYVLQDASGRLEILAKDLPVAGQIVEVKVDGGREVSRILLADCEDFFIAMKDGPNYKKMVIDESLREKLLMRGKVIAAIREFFMERGFVETETPALVRLPGMEPYLDVFKTRFEADFSAEQKLSEDMYLITSPEYAMKKLLVGGLEKIFQITKSFRNKETFSERHNPEFTILEWYRAYASYLEIMDDTEELVKFVWKKFGRDGAVLEKWERLSVAEAFTRYAGVDMFSLNDEEFFQIFMNKIEPRLGFERPVILFDYPVSMAALSKPSVADGRVAERFEVYINGIELCNAFTELNDAAEQEKRLAAEKEERAKLGKELYSVDKTFIEALKFGMPPSGGNALGVDRLIMLILGAEDIRDTLYFPHRDL